MDQSIATELLTQVPALGVVALLVWFVFKQLVKGLDRMTDVLEGFRIALIKNSDRLHDNTRTMNEFPDSIKSACRYTTK